MPTAGARCGSPNHARTSEATSSVSNASRARGEALTRTARSAGCAHPRSGNTGSNDLDPTLIGAYLEHWNRCETACPHPDEASALHAIRSSSGEPSRGHSGSVPKQYTLERAVLEGVAFALRQIVDTMVDCGGDLTRLVASGNGLANPVWRQIVADILNRPLCQRGAEGPDALQVLLKAPMIVSDHLFTPGGTGSVPSRPMNQLANITTKKMGRHGGHPSPKNDIHFGGLQSLAAAEPIKSRHLAHALSRRRGTRRPPGLDQSSNDLSDHLFTPGGTGSVPSLEFGHFF